MKKVFTLIIILLIAFSNSFSKASIKIEKKILISNEVILILSDTSTIVSPLIISADSSLISKLSIPSEKKDKREKLIAAILAFPFPFGFMGAHRVLLGCKPWVPVFYVATFGGCFGLLPMIDFCAIVFSKDITQFENNPNVFMWVK